MSDWKQKAIDHFDNQHLGKQENIDAGMWPNKTGQQIRFAALVQIGCLDNTKILDVGCGTCDFYEFLIQSNIQNFQYYGIEIHPSIYNIAKTKYPKINIENIDILESNYKEEDFDYVFASGLFNFALDDWLIRTERIISELFRISKFGVAINFLRWRKENLNPASAYAKLEDLNHIIGQLSNNFIIKADYKANDFTLFLYKKQL